MRIGMEQGPSSQWISKPFIKISHSHVNINHVYHLVFLVIGISLGIVTTLYFKTFSFHLQYFLYHVTPPSSPLLPRHHQLRPMPLLSPPPSQPPAPAPGPKPMSKLSLMHNMSDQELFLKAIKVGGKEDLRRKSKPKVAFLFLTKGALPLAPLWEKFFKGNEGFYSIYLHHHPSFNETTPQDSVFYGRKIPSQVTYLLLISHESLTIYLGKCTYLS